MTSDEQAVREVMESIPFHSDLLFERMCALLASRALEEAKSIEVYIAARVKTWRFEASRQQSPEELQAVYVNQEVAYSDVLSMVRERIAALEQAAAGGGQMAAAGKLKVGKRELSKEECELVVELLQAVAADLLMAKGS